MKFVGYVCLLLLAVGGGTCRFVKSAITQPGDYHTFMQKRKHTPDYGTDSFYNARLRNNAHLSKTPNAKPLMGPILFIIHTQLQVAQLYYPTTGCSGLLTKLQVAQVY